MNCSATIVTERTRLRGLLTICIVSLTFGSSAAFPRPAVAEHVTPPLVPANLQVPAGNTAYLEGHAVGTQDYICLPSGWTFYGPQATLFDVEGDDPPLITHFLSHNPAEGGTVRPTWQDSRDTSTVWANAIASAPSPDPSAIPWLLLTVVGAQSGKPTFGGERLIKTTYIHRLNTSGGTAPSTGCSLAADVGKKALVPYTAGYFFYRATKPTASTSEGMSLTRSWHCEAMMDQTRRRRSTCSVAVRETISPLRPTSRSSPSTLTGPA